MTDLNRKNYSSVEQSAFSDISASCENELQTKGFKTKVYLLRGGVGIKLLNKDHPSLASIAHLPVIEFDFAYEGEIALDHLSFFDIQGLSFSKSNIKSFSQLEGFSLKKLHADGTTAKDFESLALHQLEYLSLSKTSLMSLDFLENAPIQKLYLSQTEVNDQSLEVLKEKKLRALNLFKCSISSLDPIKNSELKHLVISGTQIGDLSPLASQPLKRLELRATKVECLSPLSDCPIEILHLPGSRISSINPIAYCPVSELNLIGLEIQDLSPLLSMPLQKLGISRSTLSEDNIDILKQLELNTLYSPADPEDQKPNEFFEKLKVRNN